jgi:hypothetical protein
MASGRCTAGPSRIRQRGVVFSRLLRGPRCAVAYPILLTLMLAIIASACGGDDEDVLGLEDRELDRCSLITSAEAEQWLGPAVSEPAPAEGIEGEPDPVTCRYEHEQAMLLIQV